MWTGQHGRPRYVLLTPHGRMFDQETAARFSRLPHLGLVCGRYEGVDERVLSLVDEEVSIGDYVLSGGEAAALVVIDAVSRLVPGVIGNEASPSMKASWMASSNIPSIRDPGSFMEWKCRAAPFRKSRGDTQMADGRSRSRGRS